VADWLIVLSEDNWEACAKAGLIGLGLDAERRLNRMADGDRIWIYVNKRHVDRQTPWVRRIRGVARVSGPVRRLDRPPWRARAGQMFAFARPIRLERRLDLPADVLKQLSFAVGIGAWGLRLLNAPLRLTNSDVERLQAVARS
jgi:hypothetical protein